MANRHRHKKMRAEVLARMAKTGETYQAALQRVVAGRRLPHVGETVDLVPIHFFGVPVTLATSEGGDVQTIAVLRHAARSSPPFVLPLVTWLRPQGVN